MFRAFRSTQLLLLASSELLIESCVPLTSDDGTAAAHAATSTTQQTHKQIYV